MAIPMDWGPSSLCTDGPAFGQVTRERLLKLSFK